MIRGSARRGWRLGAGLAVAACIVAVSVWTSTDEGGRQPVHNAEVVDRGAGAAPRPAGGMSVVARVGRRLHDRFRVLRTRPEGLPRGVTTLMRRPAHGLSWRLAQALPSPEGIPFWAVPGRGVVCLVGQEDGASVTTACTRTRDAVYRGVAVALLRTGRPGQPEHRLVVGLAPDGTRAVRVVTRDETTTAPVTSGFFVARDGTMDPPDRLVLDPAPRR